MEFFNGALRRVSAMASTVRIEAAEAFKAKAAEIREAVGPEKTEPVTVPERPFGRDEGGQDIKQVVWTSYTMETPDGKRFFGAAGLTDNGYYRAAEVQTYGSEELWRWQNERHINKTDAIDSAERKSAERFSGAHEWGRPHPEIGAVLNAACGPKKIEDKKMAIPEHLKAQADAVRTESGAEQYPVKDLGENKGADWADIKGMEAQKALQRQNALDDKAPQPEPDKG